MRLSKFLLFALGLAATFLIGCGDALPTEEAPAVVTDSPKLRHTQLLGHRGGKLISRYGALEETTEYVVGAASGIVEMSKLVSRYEAETGVEVKRTYRRVFRGFAIHIDQDRVQEVLGLLIADDEVAWIEPDAGVRRSPRKLGIGLGSLSLLQQLPKNIRHVGAHQSSTSAGDGTGSVDVDLYILDTGVEDDDLNVVESLSFVADGSTADRNGHGTHVAGTAAAVDDHTGLVGVAPGARVHNFKVLDDDGAADVATVIAAIDVVTERKLAAPDVPVVMNLSFGADVGTTAYTALDEAVRSAVEAGVVVVVAAGNEGIDAATISPAHVVEAITVGALTKDFMLADFSNYGAVVDLLAPGTDVLSLCWDPVFSLAPITMSGTSMAAPHVAGAAALYLAQHPTASPAQVGAALAAAASKEVEGDLGPTPALRLDVSSF